MKEPHNSQQWNCSTTRYHSPLRWVDIMSNVNSHACGAALPEKDNIKPEDSVSNVSGATTSASKTPSLKSRLRYAKRNAELRAFKKKMEMELTLADLDVEEQKAQAQARAQAEAIRAQAEAVKCTSGCGKGRKRSAKKT